ncbi:uncharacterized protein LOC107270421 isoform X1 [Cephus cinctus]|uniref:Uncharacterized protein LOC107270421 isoform X1 n=1 Tax=Cephus cinctus TaxID=211228 RepID=A0AAJ7C3H8_CEPCN|nr:uncharacterized protein LOC107270421 isoform X1 [Cephus cinctus]
MTLSLLFITFLSNVIVRSAPVPELDKFNNVSSTEPIATTNSATSGVSSVSVHEGNITNILKNLNVEPSVILNQTLDTAQDTIKNVFSTATQITDTIQGRLVTSLNHAGGAIKTTVNEQGKTIGDSVGSLIGTGTQFAETSVNLFTSFPKMGFRVLSSFGR